MKRRFNNRIATSGLRYNEVNLFRQLSDELNTRYSSSTFVREAHGPKGFVEYYSRILGGYKTVEISDLLIITYNVSINELRINFLQAKYKKTPYRDFISFRGNVFQRELLLEKPDIRDVHGFGLHSNILNFTDFMSITAYGIFYHDTSGEIDMLYTMPHYLTPKNLYNRSGITKFSFHRGAYCPYTRCTHGRMADETISTCSLELFASELLRGRIGAPLHYHNMSLISGLISRMMQDNPDNSVLESLGDYLRRNEQDFTYEGNNRSSYSEHYPDTLIVITDGDYIDEEF